VTEKKVLGFKLPRDLSMSEANIPSACKIANITQNDVILPHYARYKTARHAVLSAHAIQRQSSQSIADDTASRS
jgi:hypothetical protein